MKTLPLLCLLISWSSWAQEASLLQAGLMLGQVEMKEAVVWLQTRQVAKVYAHYSDMDAPGKSFQQTNTVLTKPHEAFTAKLYFTGLEPGHRYRYRLFLNDVEVEHPYPLAFSTPPLWHTLPEMPEVKLALASCFYVNDPEYDKPGNAFGGSFEILSQIHEQQPDAMLWLGDFTYLRRSDWWSTSQYGQDV